jgi:HPt (histidine-containing phosphotransfer) domain-containing protein
MNTLVDFDRLQSFTDGDPALEAELLGLFVLTAEGYLANLEAALAEPGRWRALAHSLKGAASNIGAPAVADLAATAERAPPDPSRLDALRATFAATRSQVDAHLERTASDAGMGLPPGQTSALSGYAE